MPRSALLLVIACWPAGCRNIEGDAPDGRPGTPPIDAAAGTSDAPAPGPADAGPPGTVGPAGGTVDWLDFAVVGDTRPASEDDTAAYPTDIITTIWQAVEDESPRPRFAVSTGDYMFASTSGDEQERQLNLYLGARSRYRNIVFPAIGNHECTGATKSNCGAGNSSGITKNYDAFRRLMLAPIGQTKPYYVVHINHMGGEWTAKFVIVAANAWDATQADWLETALSEPTTYTFIVRHEGATATEAPGVIPSADIMARHPLTLLIVGHTHTYAHYASDKEMIVGNGGAPLTSSSDYGYVVSHQRADGAMRFTAYSYQGHNQMDQFTVWPDGSSAP